MTTKDYILPALALTGIITLLIIERVPQDQGYHDFADQRMILGIQNFLNVITNLPFAIIGLIGLRTLKHLKSTELYQIGFWIFIGFLLLTIGSSYYHLWPENETLVYDRIPIVLIFMSFFSFVIHDRIDVKKGYHALIVLNIIGILSVLYWIISERAGSGDLRWYGMVQFFPIIAIPLILILYRSPFHHQKEIIPMFIFFGLAKVAEMFDKEIYHSLNNIISGHSLKHILMAAAGYQIVLLFRHRKNFSQKKVSHS